MTDYTSAVLHEEQIRIAAMERANRIIANGGRVTVQFVETPLRTVINLVERDVAGNCAGIKAVGELWVGAERRAA